MASLQEDQIRAWELPRSGSILKLNPALVESGKLSLIAECNHDFATIRQGCGAQQHSCPAHSQERCAILSPMDHIEVLREKIARLRSEIGDIQVLNDQHRFGGQKGPEAQTAHVQRQARLEEIQEELIRLSNLSHKALSIEQMRENHYSRLHPVKRVS